MSERVSITQTIRGKLPSLPFRLIKEKILGAKYELSLVFVGKKKIRSINRIYRKKDQTTDILSFPLSKKSGEIFICLEKAKSKAKKIPRSYINHIIFLFIHGLLHLKGMDHGSRMEHKERTIAHHFGVDIA